MWTWKWWWNPPISGMRSHKMKLESRMRKWKQRWCHFLALPVVERDSTVLFQLQVWDYQGESSHYEVTSFIKKLVNPSLLNHFVLVTMNAYLVFHLKPICTIKDGEISLQAVAKEENALIISRLKIWIVSINFGKMCASFLFKHK